MRRHTWIIILLNLLFLNFAYADTITLNGTLGDFYDYNQDNTKNLDFENPAYPPPSGYGSYAVTDLVSQNLNSDRKPVLKDDGSGWFMDDNGDRVGNSQHKSITNKSSFSQWFRDVDGINQSKQHDIVLTKNGDVYEYENHSFFPIDGELLGNEGGFGGIRYW